MEIFKLQDDEEFIQLNDLLKTLNWVTSGGEAKAVIREGRVIVNGEAETRVRRKMRAGDIFQFEEEKGQIA